LLQHQVVKECAVVGYRDEQDLVKPKAFIVLKEEFTPSEQLEQELKEFVKNTIAPYKYPRWIEFIESLPKNERGKVDRKKLKNQTSDFRPSVKRNA
jgi:benzoate-CoA ligase